jgi:hypothetical protein
VAKDQISQSNQPVLPTHFDEEVLVLVGRQQHFVDVRLTGNTVRLGSGPRVA